MYSFGIKCPRDLPTYPRELALADRKRTRNIPLSASTQIFLSIGLLDMNLPVILGYRNDKLEHTIGVDAERS
jgi:hypothetical protein